MPGVDERTGDRHQWVQAAGRGQQCEQHAHDVHLRTPTRNVDVNVTNMSSNVQGTGVRAAATEATAQRILDSASDLFGESPFAQVTLAAVADDAGVTVQTVIRRFGSKERLFSAVARRRSIALRTARDEAIVGDVADAVAVLVEGYERWGAEVLQLLAQERQSPVIAQILVDARRFHRDWVARMFAPQLDRTDGATRGHELAKLVAVTDLYTWKVLRHDSGLDADQARTALTEMVEALTGPPGMSG